MRENKTGSEIIDCIPAAEAGTLPGLLKCRGQRSPDQPAYRRYDSKESQWLIHTWQDVVSRTARWQRGLEKEGLRPGERVALLLANGPDWVCFEQAGLGLGLVVVPLYTWDSPGNIAYLLRDSGSKLLLTGTAEQWRQLAPHADSFPELAKIICLEDKPLTRAAGVAAETVCRWLPAAGGEFSVLPAAPDSLATIVYTSGTTGPPKGVMLSHKNILWNAEAILQVAPCYSSDVLLSFLPLSHTFERTVGYYVPMMAGCTVAYARSMEELAEDLRTVRPTIIISVPRIFEKVYVKVVKQVAAKSPWARQLFQLTLDTGWDVFEDSQGRGAVSVFRKHLLWPLLRELAAARILNRLGGRIRLAVSGGAPLRQEVSRFFLSLGLPLVQGYGLTEAAPVVSANTLEHNVPASVGPALPGAQCRIGHNDELLVKSPGVMSGYWNRPDKTAAAFDSEGWLHTGDVVAMVRGDIFVRGRLKEIIVTSTGEKVPPAAMEMAITADPLVDQAMVVGEGMPYLAALLVLRRFAWEELAAKCGRDPADPSALEAPAAKQAVIERLAELLQDFPGNARIRTVALLLDEWSIANGLLTPTLKLKRGEIAERYARKIRELYEGHEVV